MKLLIIINVKLEILPLNNHKMKRRSMLKSMGAISLGIVTPSLSNTERLVEPYKTKKQNISTYIPVVGGGTADST